MRIKLPASTKGTGFSPLSQVRKLSSSAYLSLLGRAGTGSAPVHEAWAANGWFGR
ncbi:hypothetical protein M378DRAFT_156981 [Amanita muscaria Koide BX008]|uniref:Uncharacterized protein n=1 Tax=Amanita muscaria (strain Koide BX008) TaxID=946122 RepID=A0A0C2XKY4_AMAMK|nr:hypothetical protein M378DRAFT_156981 [Amanita muscaria Koide BX008]